jgi:hypothetical protein
MQAGVRRDVLWASTRVTPLKMGDVLDGTCEGADAGEDLVLGGLVDAVEWAERDEGQDDLLVFGAVVVAPQQLGNGPGEARVVVGR